MCQTLCFYRYIESGRQLTICDSFHARFTFDHVDPNDPSRLFTFTLFLNDEDNYDVSYCNPKIDSKDIAKILEETNASSDAENMSILARLMRRAFKSFCDHE